MQYYAEISQEIRAIFRRYTDTIEPLSLDEAYLDVTGSALFNGSATLIAEDIRRAIKDELQLTASAGVAPNKFIAKIASDENKPDGQCVVAPGDIEAFVAELPLKKIPGVGKVTMERLATHGLETCADVRKMGEQELVRRLGSLGEMLYRRAQGIDDRPLTTNWVRKSLSVERTFPEDITDPDAARQPLDDLFDELTSRLERAGDRHIRNQQVKLKFSDFRTTTMERGSVELNKLLFEELMPAAWQRGNGKGIRLLGIGVTFRDPDAAEDTQLTLF
jgi:DNA polymerase-4